MTTRAELEEEWTEYQLWASNQSLDFSAYLEHRDLQIAKQNLDTLKSFIEGLDDDETLTVSELKELLRHA